MWSTLVVLSVIGCALAGPPVSKSRDEIESFRSFLEGSRQEDGIRLESRMLENPKASVWENSGKYQGDILLNEEQAESLVQQYAEGRNAWIVPNTRWPHNTIVYEFNNEFDQGQVNAIYAAMNEIQARTCIRFRRREWWEHNYVLITGRPDGCYANVGFLDGMGRHTFNVARNAPGHGCFSHVIIIHEWLHVVGFMHMQSTYNRYDYVQVLWGNISPGMHHNFDRYGQDLVHNMGLPYEYASTMHYGRYGFSHNGQPTLLPIHNDDGQMGQQSYITGWDWLRANRHYNCPGAWSEEISTEEQAPGVNLNQAPEELAIEEVLKGELLVAEVGEGIAPEAAINEEALSD